mgnify:FL=1
MGVISTSVVLRVQPPESSRPQGYRVPKIVSWPEGKAFPCSRGTVGSSDRGHRGYAGGVPVGGGRVPNCAAHVRQVCLPRQIGSARILAVEGAGSV